MWASMFMGSRKGDCVGLKSTGWRRNLNGVCVVIKSDRISLYILWRVLWPKTNAVKRG